MGEIWGNLSLGAEAAFTGVNLLYCAIGVSLGTLVGVIPGIGAIAAIAMLIPLSFHLEPLTALVMLSGIYYGGTYGGSIAAILLNVPGSPSSAVTCLDGHPMAQQGRAGVALLSTTVASFFGGSVGILILSFFAPVISRFALEFGAPEFFSLMVLGLVAASVVSAGSAVRSVAMVVLGITVGTIGIDVYTGAERFTFGQIQLMDGVSLVAIAMGLFGIAEVIASVHQVGVGHANARYRFRDMLPTKSELRRAVMPMLRGTGIGAFFGTLPGTGGTVAAYMSYAVEKKTARDQSRFGKGAIEGITGPESANNAADQTAFIPTLTLGIPGSATMALILGVLVIHGITPGPTLMTNNADLFWGLVMSFWVGNLLLLALNVPLIALWVKILEIPYKYIYPSILVFISVGVYSVNSSVFDIYLVAIVGALGYAMRVFEFPPAPFLLGFVLGPDMEENFRRSMLLSHGNLDILFSRPLSLAFMIAALAIVAFSLMVHLRSWRASASARRRG